MCERHLPDRTAPCLIRNSAPESFRSACLKTSGAGPMLLPKGVEEAQFKRTESGWIFSAPNPWTFGWRRSYRVDDVHKAALALCVRRGRYFRLLVLILMYALPLATFWHFPSLLRAPSPWAWLLLAL